MQPYETFTAMICLGALFSYINFRYIRLPQSIGVMALSMSFSVLLFVSGKIFPIQAAYIMSLINGIDFYSLLINCLLGLLLFAGSMHIDADGLRKERLPVVYLATIGIVISTLVIAALLYWLLPVFRLSTPFIYCLAFAALISPTDPVATLSILKKAGLSKTLELRMAGESLFNDGVAVVVFLVTLQVAQTGFQDLSFTTVLFLFLRQACGGLAYGFLLGMFSQNVLSKTDSFSVRVMITIAIVTGGYMLAQKAGISGPLAMVVAGIMTGNRRDALNKKLKISDNLGAFWELMDDVLNNILFMLMGLEMVVISFNRQAFFVGVVCILFVLVARWLSVVVPLFLLRRRIPFQRYQVVLLTWGGLRGALSVALALSLPTNMHRDMFLTITYIVVVFSVMVQGLTIGSLYRRLEKRKIVHP